MIEILIAVATVVVCALVSLWIYGRWNFGTLEKLGIPVVAPHHPLLGSVRELYKEVGVFKDLEWMKKYGPVYGVYEGRLPQVCICDAELVRQVCTADAEYFNGKRFVDFGDPVLNEMPDFMPYNKWKVVRAMSSPAFSTAKMRLMNLPMREAILDFVQSIKSQIKKSDNKVLKDFAIDEAIHTMLTDLVTRCVFSIKINDPTSKDNPFAKLVHEIFKQPEGGNSLELTIWSHTFPFLKKFMNTTFFDPKPMNDFLQIFKQIMAERRKTDVKKGDVVDLAMEWYDKLDSPEYKSLQITEMTLLCQVLVFFFGGQDQISTIAAAMFYHLATEPEIEAKVYKELDAVFEKHNGKIEHEHLSELVYLNACLNESLRLYPFFYKTERICTKDWRNEKYNLSIKKGTVVALPIWAINRNPDHFENPDKYDPTRWLPQNRDKMNTYASASFGHGPRACPGKRFATDSLTMVAAYVLKELRFVTGENSKLSFVPAGPVLAAHEKICLNVVERSSTKAPSG